MKIRFPQILTLAVLLSVILIGCAAVEGLIGGGSDAPAPPALNPQVVEAVEPAAEPVQEVAVEPAEVPAAVAEDAAQEAVEIASEESDKMETETIAEPPAESEPAAEAARAAERRIYRIIAAESQAGYAVEEEFFGRNISFFTAMGTTNEIAGKFEVTIEDNQVKLEQGEFVVDLRTLTSDDSRRDNRIRRQWLESDLYPFAEFSTTGIESFPENAVEGQDVSFKVNGEMTIREITNPLMFDMTARLENNRLTGTGTTFLYMRDFGFEPPEILGALKVTDGVTVTVQFAAEETAEGS